MVCKLYSERKFTASQGYGFAAEQANNLTEWVAERLNKLDNVSGYETVNEKTDVNGLLGQENGYVNCIYFSLDSIEQNKVPGKTISEKGTDCGGAIEIYKNKQDAQNRCLYLSSYDNTLLYSGSYAIVGTMVIRFSYILDGETQFELTNELTKLFTEI